MAETELTMACDVNLLTRPLYDGDISPRDIDLDFVSADDMIAMFSDMIRHEAYDVAEMSMSSVIMAATQAEPDFAAIPVFPSRVFRHGSIYVHTDSGIDKPADLVGTKVGVPSYSMTTALWVRGILADEYGVDSSDMTWVQRTPQGTGADDPLSFDLPDEVEVTTNDAGDSLEGLLERGDLDALISASVPEALGSSVERLFSDHVSVEQSYHERTGYFPIMHTVVVRGERYRNQEWIADELVRAFRDAKAFVLDDLHKHGHRRLSIPWISSHLDEVRAHMGADYWPYGIEENRAELGTMIDYAVDQHLITDPLSVDELFVQPSV